MHVRQRAPLAAPTLASLSTDAKALLGEADYCAHAIMASPGPRIADDHWAEQAGRSARHSLADAAEQRVGPVQPRQGADRLERAAAGPIASGRPVRSLFASPVALLSHATGIARSCGAVSSVRSGHLSTAPDRSGVRVGFASPHHIPGQLGAICELGRQANGSVLLQAISLQAMWLNLHVLTDGNGRVGRVMLNLCLWRQRTGSELYLPLNGLRSGYGPSYEIAVRAAEIQGDWFPLVHLFHSLLRSYSQL